MTSSGGRQSTGRLIVVLLGLGGLLLAGWLGSQLWRSLTVPRSERSGGSATWQGEWVGPLTLTDGMAGELHLTLVDTIDEMEDFSSPNLEGTAQYCLGDSTGEFELIGHVARNGSVEWLDFRSYEATAAWLFYTDGGQYNGDTLVLNGRYSFDPAGQHIARSDEQEPELSIVLSHVPSTTALTCP